MKLLSSLIKQSDFEQLKHFVLLKNDTSGTGILETGKIKITSLEDGFINLSTPPKAVGPGHSVTLYIYKAPIDKEELKKIKNRNFKSAFEVIGKVVETQNQDDTQYIKVELTQYDIHSWKSICLEYEKAQTTIFELIDQEDIDGN